MNIYILARFLTKKFKRTEIEMQELRVSENSETEKVLKDMEIV